MVHLLERKKSLQNDLILCLDLYATLTSVKEVNISPFLLPSYWLPYVTLKYRSWKMRFHFLIILSFNVFPAVIHLFYRDFFWQYSVVSTRRRSQLNCKHIFQYCNVICVMTHFKCRYKWSIANYNSILFEVKLDLGFG